MRMFAEKLQNICKYGKKKYNFAFHIMDINAISAS